MAMKQVLPILSALALACATLVAAPLAVGSISDDVGFSQGTVFSGGVYRALEQRRLSDYPDKAVVLVYFTPW
jgi:hypothetical protein